MNCLAGKRVDVKVVGIRTFPNSKHFRNSPTLIALEGREGYLLLESPFERRSLEKAGKIKVYGVGKNLTAHQVPATCVRPLREFDGRALTEVSERVVIIGPDVNNNEDGQGRYAQTQPQTAHTYGAHSVAVRFERLGIDAQSSSIILSAFYPLSSLVGAKNVQMQIANTVFPASQFE